MSYVELIMMLKSAQLDSDLVRLNVFGNNIIVLNSPEAVSDLLERRSSNYSDRYVNL